MYSTMNEWCHHCGNDPCHRIVYEEVLSARLQAIDPDIPPNTARRDLYRIYVLGFYGHLGRGIRVEIPTCVRDYIRELCPDPSGEYMGHRAAATDDIDEDWGRGAVEYEPDYHKLAR